MKRLQSTDDYYLAKANLAEAEIKEQELIERVARELGRNARAEVVFGEPVERDGLTVIPVAVASIGLGAGGRSGKELGEGGTIGAGMRVSPVGYIQTGGGRVRFRRILPTWALASISVGIGTFAGALLLWSLQLISPGRGRG